MRRCHVVLGCVLGLTFAAPAAAQSGDSSSCRASATRISTVGDIVTEPVRANAPSAPCQTQSASVLEPTPLGPVTVDAVGAFTVRGEGGGGGALASASNVDIVLGGLTINVDALQASSITSCETGSPVSTGASKVVNLVIGGQTIAIPAGDAPFSLDLGVAQIALNEEVVEGGRLTRRALRVTSPLAEVIVAEAISGATDCPGAGGGGGGGGVPPVCPPGSTYQPSGNVCIIAAGSNGATSTIVIGRPFEGPSGGSVLPLETARRQFKSACLKGKKGRRYAIIGTKGGDNITGTNGRDRILLLAGKDQSEGGRGDDCIDGGKGSDTMSGALGQDRLIGRGGRDHLVGGSHSDLLRSGRHNDTINTGFGRDRVFGGAGRDRINSSTAGPAARRLRCGKGRDKLRINSNERRRARGCELVYVLR